MTAGTQRSFQLLLLAIDGNLTGTTTRSRQCTITPTAAVTETMDGLSLRGMRLQGLGEGNDETWARLGTVGTESRNPDP